MKRQEALKDFKEKVTNNLVNEYKAKFEENFNENQEKVRELLMEGMKKLIRRAKNLQEVKEAYKIAYFQFEFLRINVLNESYKIFIHGYNPLWYLDKDSLYEEIDLKFLFAPFIEVKEKLIKEKKIYIGKINNYDIQEFILNLAVDCYNDMSKITRNWFWNIDEEILMKETSIENFYTIRWGEYQGKSEILFAMDNREKYMEELLELKKQPEKKLPFVYTVWKNSTLEDGELTKQEMQFINFKGSKLKKIDFSESEILRGQFKDTQIKECKFNGSGLIGASFENTIIHDSDFSNSDCMGVDFQKSELCYVDFKNSNLRNSSFVNAKFKNVSFEGANLENSIFSEKDIPFIHLTSEQLQTIYIYGGNK